MIALKQIKPAVNSGRDFHRLIAIRCALSILKVTSNLKRLFYVGAANEILSPLDGNARHSIVCRIRADTANHRKHKLDSLYSPAGHTWHIRYFRYRWDIWRFGMVY